MTDQRRVRLLLSPLTLLVALLTLIGAAASSAAASAGPETRVRAFDTPTVITVGPAATESPGGVGQLRPETDAIVSGSGVATKVGGGSGPWVDDALSTPVPGMTRPQSLPGSCVSACGEVLTGVGRTEAQLLDALGEWSNPRALADELGAGWLGGTDTCRAVFADYAGGTIETTFSVHRTPIGIVASSSPDILMNFDGTAAGRVSIMTSR